MLFGREIKVVKIDKATMDYYIRLTNFYHQFQAIGNNYNQTVKAVKSNFSDKRALALLYKIGENHDGISGSQQADHRADPGIRGEIPEP